MPIRPIRMFGDPVLRDAAAEVETFDAALARIVEDMWATMYHAEGIGLAAPQVGLSMRVLVVDVRRSSDNGPSPVALVNPAVVEASSERERALEGCLSIPGLEDVVERPAWVVVAGWSPEGEPIEVPAEGLFARALQHEIDHLDGVLFLDRVSPLKRRMLLKKWQKSRDRDDV